jgi:hypothetical protein
MRIRDERHDHSTRQVGRGTGLIVLHTVDMDLGRLAAEVSAGLWRRKWACLGCMKPRHQQIPEDSYWSSQKYAPLREGERTPCTS